MPEVVVSLLGSAGNAGKPPGNSAEVPWQHWEARRRNAGQAMDFNVRLDGWTRLGTSPNVERHSWAAMELVYG